MTRKTLGRSVGLSDMRDDVLSIIGYAGEFSEPNRKPVTAFYTDRYLSPVLEALVEYIEMREARARKEERDDYGDHMYDVGYQRGVDDTNNKHDRLCTPPIIARKETLKEVIHVLNEMIVDDLLDVRPAEYDEIYPA